MASRATGETPAQQKSQSKAHLHPRPRPPPVKRFITTDNDDGKSIFLDHLSETPPLTVHPDGLESTFYYGTTQSIPNLSGEGDVAAYEHLIDNPPGIIIPNGTVARLIDFPPGYESPMHRTISINYGCVIQGEIEMVLDSGEARRLGPGDAAVQRAANHAWKNLSSTQWARMVAFAVPVIPWENRGPLKETGTDNL